MRTQKSTQYRDRRLAYCTQREQQCHQRLLYVSPHGGHLTACSPCQEVGTNTIHRPLTLDQRHAEFLMCTSQKRTSSHCWPSGGSHHQGLLLYLPHLSGGDTKHVHT